jgi:hypothetical protein
MKKKTSKMSVIAYCCPTFAQTLVLVLALPLVGCAELIGMREPVPYKDQVAAPEQCFRSYLLPSQPPNPKATKSVATWYAGLTPAIVKELANDGNAKELGDRAMAHAIAAGVPEGDFLTGAHPDPAPACGVFWNYEDVGDYRFRNAASAAMSVARRAAFAACASEFDEFAPKVSKLAQQTTRELRDLPREASPYAVWSTYHRAVAAHHLLMPVKNPNAPPVFAYAGTPYVVFKDMITRFANTPMAFLNYHWLGGVSPLPDSAPRHVQPLDAPTDNDKLLYCAHKLRNEGPLYSDFNAEQIARLFHEFDGQAWLDAQPTTGESYHRGALHIDQSDLRPGQTMDRVAGGQGDKADAEKENFRLYQRTITAVALKDGKGTVELTIVNNLRTSYDCKEVVRINRESADSATITRDNVCKYDDTVVTDKLTLGVDTLPPGVSLEKGDELIFFARRTAKDNRDGSKPSTAGRASFRTTTATADLIFLAAVRRGSQMVFPGNQ